MSPSVNRRLRRQLLSWYDRHRRHLPWRAESGEVPDPYRVWLSEIMLQQTTVATAGAYFERFLRRWPTIEDLAQASLDEVLHAWQGLGYYARARNLHRCAQMVAADHRGRFPQSEAALRELPGIGDYTAAAIAAIAFEQRTTPVDGNIIRVISRLYAVAEPLPKAKTIVAAHAAPLMPAKRVGDFAQALMDIGATVCTPRNPSCETCPWLKTCAAYAQGRPESFPVKAPKRPRPTRRGIAYWITRADGALLLRRRAETGLLGGMMEVPTSEWREDAWSAAEAKSCAPIKARWKKLDGVVEHTFTHFHLELTVMTAALKDSRAFKDGTWCPTDQLSKFALPTVMKKVAKHVHSS